MKLHFYVRYRTRLGENLMVEGSIPELEQPLSLRCLNDEFWHGSIQIDPKTAKNFRYAYVFEGRDGAQMREWGDDRRLDLSALRAEQVQFIDFWSSPGAVENAFFSQAFQVLSPSPASAGGDRPDGPFSHVLRAKAPLLKPGQRLAVVGAPAELGEWKAAGAVAMAQNGEWHEARLDLSGADFPVAYKYAILEDGQLTEWESGENRLLYDPGSASKLTVAHDGFARLRRPWFRGAGAAIPVFSLRTERSFGTGEFTDLAPLADWAAEVGLKLIQLLPINDTSATGTYLDSYPYAAISAFALHPLYLNIFEAAGAKNAAKLKLFEKLQKALNEGPTVDHETVMAEKWKAIRILFEADKKDFLSSEDEKAWFERNRAWLEPYAAFCFFKEKHGTPNFGQWPAEAREHRPETVARLFEKSSKDRDAALIHVFVQWHLHRQLRAAVEHCHARGLVLKGDIPIGIYRHSCDAWVEPELYNMDWQAGAPPDDFAEAGQNWGFPTYDWAAMKADGFRWWRRRFEQMSDYFDAFRIDHILGFFRIWSIPIDAVEGIMGRFVPCLPIEHNEFWQNGIPFDRERFCEPHITPQLLNELFGEAALDVAAGFLEKSEEGRWRLRPEFKSQRQVEAHFEKTGAGAEQEALKKGLFRLISNVLLFERPGGRAFDFRFGIEKTESFQSLSGELQGKLKALYLDYFYRRQDDFWRREALEKLPALKRATPMLICGEDLGMVPDCVPGVMRDLGLLSLEIQRMPKDPRTAFFRPETAPYLSVVTPSTHDMSTLRGWWEEDRAQTQRFFNEILGQEGAAAFYCEPWICRMLLDQHLRSPAMWAIFQIQDLLSMDGALRRENPADERINEPADPKHHWNYRMHLTPENLRGQTGFNEALRYMIRDAGRA